MLEKDERGEKVVRLADGTFIKLFRRRRRITSDILRPYARRFVDNALALEKLGIPSPKIIALYRIPEMSCDVVHYHPLPGMTLRAIIANELELQEARHLRLAFNIFVRRLHEKGIYFRSLHLGNVVLTPRLGMGLIDISDVRLHGKPLSRFWRARNLRRMEDMADEREWVDRDIILNKSSIKEELRKRREMENNQ